MKKLGMLKQYITDSRGATMIEYGLIAALVALVLIGALTTLGTSLETAFEGVNAGFAEPT